MNIEGAGKSLGLDALLQFTGSGIQFLSGTVFYIIAAHIFSQNQIGAIALLVAVLGLINAIFNFGIGTAAQHFISFGIGSKNNSYIKKTIFKIFILGILLSLVAYFILLSTSYNISVVFFHSNAYQGIINNLAIVIVGYILFWVINGILLGMQKFKISAIINIITWTSYYFSSTLLSIYTRSLSSIIDGWEYTIYAAVAMEILIIFFAERDLEGTHNSMAPSYKSILKYSFPVFLSSLIGYGAIYADRFIVAGLLNLSSLGIYNFSLLIASSMNFIVLPFNNILLPRFSELYGKRDLSLIKSQVGLSSTLLSFIYVPASMLVAGLSGNILDILVGKSYVDGSMPLIIILFFLAAFCSQNVISQALASIQKTKLFVFSSTTGILSNIAISIYLTTQIGLIGAAIGYSSVYAVMFVILFYFAKKENIATVDFVAIGKIWASSLIMFACLILLQQLFRPDVLSLFLYIIFGFIGYLVILRFLRLFSSFEKSVILSLFSRNYIIRKVLYALLYMLFKY